MSLSMVLTVVLPILGGLTCQMMRNCSVKMQNWVVLVFTILPLPLLATMFWYLVQHSSTVVSFPVLLPSGIHFRLDWLSAGLAAAAAIIWLLVTVYSFDYMKQSHSVHRYSAVSLVTLGATLGTLLSGDLLTLFLFFELMSLSSFMLVIHEGTEKALRAGRLYLLMTIGGGLAVLFGVLAVFDMQGSTLFLDQGTLTSASPLSLAAFLGFIIGFGMKAGMFPLHVWLPEAHPVAPSPASALLSGVMLKVGAFGLLRVMHNVYDFTFLASMGWTDVLLAAAGITIVIGSVLAIKQTNLKRRLAYSSVGQMGYILLGMSLVSETALVGDIFHIFTHAAIKSCLFLAAGAMIMKTGKTDIDDFRGIGLKMPVTMICFTAAALAMIGIPPFNGFLSKWLLGLGALESGHPGYASLLLISSLLNSIYYFPIIANAFFGRSNAELSGVQEVSYRMLIPIIVLALATILFDVIPLNVPLELSTTAAARLLSGGVGF